MPMKRNRVGTEEELTLMDATKPPPLPQNQTENYQVRERSDVSHYPLKLAEFLEKCHYCKKKMPEGAEIFMYRDFTGFCSVACRDMQIALDQLAEKQVASYKVKVNQSQGMANMNIQYRYK